MPDAKPHDPLAKIRHRATITAIPLPQVPDPTAEQMERIEAQDPAVMRADNRGLAVARGPAMPSELAARKPPEQEPPLSEPHPLVQPPTASVGSGSPRKPRRKIGLSDDSVYISGPKEVLERFRGFHAQQQYAAYHDSLTALMNLAQIAIDNGYADE